MTPGLDFEADLIAIARDELRRWGVRSLVFSEEQVLLRFFVLHHRVVDAGPYRVQISGPAFANYLRLSSSLKDGFCRLIRRAQEGEPLWPHQSRQLLMGRTRRGRPGPEHDLLFNDWGIQHFHLGLRQSGVDGFVERTNDLCLAIAAQGVLSVIDVRPHGNWGDVELLEIIERHWPSLLDHAVLKGVAGVEYPAGFTYEEARRSGLLTMITLSSGRILAPPGGGYATAGNSMRAVIGMDRIMDGLRRLEEYVTQNAEQIQQDVRTARRTSGGLDLHVILRNGSLEIFDRTSESVLRLPDGRGLCEWFGI